jgi:hypothetical protein
MGDLAWSPPFTRALAFDTPWNYSVTPGFQRKVPAEKCLVCCEITANRGRSFPQLSSSRGQARFMALGSTLFLHSYLISDGSIACCDGGVRRGVEGSEQA